MCDEEDELSEVEPDAVPTEVRDWLALTFTRSMSNIKRRGDDKPKFRSVANAIRAGIMVDRYGHEEFQWCDQMAFVLKPTNLNILIITNDEFKLLLGFL